MTIKPNLWLKPAVRQADFQIVNDYHEEREECLTRSREAVKEFCRMRKMKDSGIPWIGRIPEARDVFITTESHREPQRGMRG